MKWRAIFFLFYVYFRMDKHGVCFRLFFVLFSSFFRLFHVLEIGNAYDFRHADHLCPIMAW